MSFCLEELKSSGRLARMCRAKKRALEDTGSSENQVNDIVSSTGQAIEAPGAIDEDEIMGDQLETDEESFSDEDYWDESPRDDDGQSFQRGLRNWALMANISHVHLSLLLLLIRSTTNFYVPKDARTFLKTPVRVGRQIAHLAGGQLWYHGIKTALQNYFCKIKPAVDGFEINLSMDGLPMHKSGPTQLWPILMQLHNIIRAPVLVVGVFCGVSKPTNCEDYLRPLVDELNELLLNGLYILEKLYSIQLRAIIADTPALLKYLPQWKGTEMRTFLHYASIAILPEMLSDDAFHHFKLFFCAITMLSSNHYKQYWEYAGTLLTAFVEQFSNIYNRNHLTSNIHNLIHVSDEVCRFGPLDSMSTYPFENKLQIIKNQVRGGSRTLEQIICRMTERIEMEIEEENDEKTYPALKIWNQEVILNISDRFMLRKGNKDGWFLTKSNTIAKYDSASETAGAITIHCRALLNQSPAFSYPCAAEKLYMYKADMANISPTVTTLDVWDVKCKLAVAKTSQQADARFTPLLHTLEWDN